jgi:hypothetical protein
LIGALSFGDARPRGSSDIDYQEKDEWRFSDMVTRLQLERGALVFDADYVRGRMMKTRVTVGPDGKFVVETRNRHEMAVRWLRAIRKEAHPARRSDRDSRDAPGVGSAGMKRLPAGRQTRGSRLRVANPASERDGDGVDHPG